MSNINARSYPKNQTLNYKQLNALVNQFTNYLLNKNIKKGYRVIVNIDNPIWRTIAFLACAKIGAVYIPISKKKNNNIAYNKSIITNCAPALILTSSNELPKLAKQSVVQNFDKNTIKEILNQPIITKHLSSIDDYEDYLYMIHSSGTTGKPKGIPIVNAGMKYWEETLLNNWIMHDKNPHHHNVLGNANPDFDVHIWEMLMAWIVGGKIHFTEEYQRNHASQLIRFLIDYHITDATLTPSVVRLFSDDDFFALKQSGLKNLYVTGEACTPEIADKCKKYGINLYNCYGATEETFGLSIYLCNPNEFYKKIAPIAIPKSKEIITMIVDKNGSQVIDGQEGELVVISPYLTKGYIPQNISANINIQHTGAAVK
ncbi:MAG: amino acid adenylation domain-containing protein [Gammaproteobacteria bacterium]|nr:amino acid adenylation domain-containing protein [Gammaproteobacteria bacterium]